MAKYIIKTGRPAAARSAAASSLPSARCMAKGGGVSPTLVPTGAAGGSGAAGVGADGSVGGGIGVAVGGMVAVGGGGVGYSVGDGGGVR